MRSGTPTSLTGGSYLTTGSPASIPPTASSSSRAASTEQQGTNTSSISNGLCNESPALQAQTPGTPTKCMTHDKPLLFRTSTTPNPFSNLPGWQALGFQNPHASPERDESFTNAANRPTTANAKTTPTHKRAQSTAQTSGKQPWTGSEMFNESHRPLSLGYTIFDPRVGDRRRLTYLSGFGKEDLPPLELGDESSKTGQRGGRSGRRGRGGGFQGGAHEHVTDIREFEEERS